jgi:hypothetical protein
MGRRVPPLAEDDARSEGSEWELRERRERGEEAGGWRLEAEGLDAEVEEEAPLFLPTPSFMTSLRRFRLVLLRKVASLSSLVATSQSKLASNLI